MLFSCGTPHENKKKDEIVSGDIGAKLEQQLTPFVKNILKDHHCESSLAIGVTKGNEIVYAKAFGYADINSKDTANIYTVYNLASLSKPFVATAIMQLQDEGQLDLDDPIVKHLPYFKLKSEGYGSITIKQVLTHTSGLPKNLRRHEWENVTYADDALEGYVRSASDTTLEFEPGTDYNYSDVGFNTLGDLIAKVSGMSFEAYMKQNIFIPAKMNQTTFLKPKVLPGSWAKPHIIGATTTVWNYYPYNRMYAPCTGLNSTVFDMCQWGIINLNRGEYKDAHLLDTAAYSQLIYPWAKTPWNEHIGLSWFLQSYEGMNTILHTGASIGFGAQMIMYPEEDISIVVMANRDYSRTARIANAIIEVIKDLEVKTYRVSARFPFGREWETQGYESAKKMWQELLKDTTDNYYANEWEMNLIGHGLIFEKDYEKAKKAFQINIETFPNAPNVYDSYGDALLAQGDTSEAIKYFYKALEVDPNFDDPKPKLDALSMNIKPN